MRGKRRAGIPGQGRVSRGLQGRAEPGVLLIFQKFVDSRQWLFRAPTVHLSGTRKRRNAATIYASLKCRVNREKQSTAARHGTCISADELGDSARLLALGAGRRPSATKLVDRALLSLTRSTLAESMSLSEDSRTWRQDARVMDIFQNYWFWVVLVLGWIFSAAVDTMPDVQPDSSLIYSWLYRFLHVFVANAKSAFYSAERARTLVVPPGPNKE